MLSKIFKWTGIVPGSLVLLVVTLVVVLSAIGKTRLAKNDDPEPKLHARPAILHIKEK